jgi:hypothetical protein
VRHKPPKHAHTTQNTSTRQPPEKNAHAPALGAAAPAGKQVRAATKPTASHRKQRQHTRAGQQRQTRDPHCRLDGPTEDTRKQTGLAAQGSTACDSTTGCRRPRQLPAHAPASCTPQVCAYCATKHLCSTCTPRQPNTCRNHPTPPHTPLADRPLTNSPKIAKPWMDTLSTCIRDQACAPG